MQDLLTLHPNFSAQKSKINLRCKRKAESDVDDKPQILPSLIGIPDDSDDVQQG